MKRVEEIYGWYESCSLLSKTDFLNASAQDHLPFIKMPGRENVSLLMLMCFLLHRCVKRNRVSDKMLKKLWIFSWARCLLKTQRLALHDYELEDNIPLRTRQLLAVWPTSGVSNFLSKAYVWLRMGMTQIKRCSVWLRMGMTLEIKRCSTSLKEGFMEFIFTHWNLTQNQNNCTTGCCCQRQAARTQPTISFMPHNECCLPMFHCKYLVAAFKTNGGIFCYSAVQFLLGNWCWL